MKIYNKLVRDNIPEIIEKNGKAAKLRKLNDEEYKIALYEKLREEVAELIEAENVEEMADVLEVLESICKLHGFSEDEVLKEKERKAKSNGGFDKRLLLEAVIDS